MLENTLHGRFLGSASDHLTDVSPLGIRPTTGHSLPSPGISYSQPFSSQIHPAPEAERMSHWQPPLIPNVMRDSSILGSIDEQNHSSPPDFAALPAQTISAPPGLTPILPQPTPVNRTEGMDDIPTATAASFFRTYFQFIHPQYPFLSISDCGVWYTKWKMAPVSNPISR